MNGIIKTFTDIMLFKKGPQDLPSSKTLLNVFIIANLLISFIPNDVNYNLGISFITSLIYVGASLFFIQTVLSVKENMSSTTGYRIRYSYTTGTNRGTVMTDTSLSSSEYRQRFVNADDYRAQEHPSGSSTVINSYYLKISKS